MGLCHKGSQRDKATEQRRPWGPSRVLSPKLQALEAPSQTPATPAARGGREVILSVHSLGLEGARPPGLLSGGDLKPARRACRCNLASSIWTLQGGHGRRSPQVRNAISMTPELQC